jgi:hypothetical protein
VATVLPDPRLREDEIAAAVRERDIAPYQPKNWESGAERLRNFAISGWQKRQRRASRCTRVRTSGADVPHYRSYYLDAIDRVASVDVIQCDTDADAKARADRLLFASSHLGIEIWDRSRMVNRVRKTDELG